MATVLKQLVETTRGDRREQRRRGEAVQLRSTEFEASVEPQRRLATIVKESADQLARCLEGLVQPQLRLMQGVQEYLGFDVAGLDESALALVQAGATFIEACTATQQKNHLRDVCKACDEILKECEGASSSLKDRDESYKEFQHYEQKVAAMLAQGQPLEREKLARNREKLAQAMAAADERRRASERLLKDFAERRAVHARASLHPLLRTYARLVAGWGGSARAVADLFEKELAPGVSVEVVGLLKKPELNGQIGVVQRHEGGRLVIAFDEGTERAIRPENVCPLDALSSEDELANAAASVEPLVKVSPASGPAHGYDAEVTVQGLFGEICDVFVGGQPAKVLEVSAGRARVRMPKNLPGMPLPTEVRTTGWRRCIAQAQEPITYFEPVQFGACGANVDLSASEAASQPSDDFRPVATRREGLVHGIALTSAALLPATRPAPKASCDSPSCLLPAPHETYYFEVGVLDVRSERTSRTLSLGFAWPDQEPTQSEASSRACWARGGHMPENALGLPRSFVVGGDLPKAHLGSAEVSRITGWRPLLDVVAGSVLGALLERFRGASGRDSFRLTVFQDGRSRCSVEAEVPLAWRFCGAPHGVVDVCGHVTSVELHQDAPLPLEQGLQRQDSSSQESLAAEQVDKAEK